MLRRACVRAFASPFSQDWRNPDFSRPKPIANYVVFRDTLQVHFAAYPARFQSGDKYMFIKDRGSLLVEFIPKEVSLTDPSKKTLLLRNKKVMSLQGEDFHQVIDFKGEVQVTRKYKEQPTTLTFKQAHEGVSLHLTVAEPASSEPVSRDITLRPGEFYLVQRYLEYSLPFVMGWYALGNGSLAEQNLSYETSPRADPFEKI